MSRLKPGDTLGTCKIEAFIAEGGMATVYRARQTLMNRTVAVKVLRPQLLDNQKVLANFLKEGMAGARLTHPSIAQVFYTAEENGTYYIVMEFVDGEDLLTVLRRQGPFPVRRALEIGRQVAEVLSFSHDRGIIHRDIKPGNIMVSRSRQIVLTDFGIASLLSDGHYAKKAGTSGTPAYMSPEQFRGEVVDERSDLYSLGATLYALLLGSPPFKGSKEKPLPVRVLKDRPRPLRDALPDIPRSVSNLVDRLLAKEPDARFQRARDVVMVIDEALSDRALISSKVPRLSQDFVWRKSFWWPVIISVAAVWVFAACLFFAMTWAAPEFTAVSGADANENGGADGPGAGGRHPHPDLGDAWGSLEQRFERLAAALTERTQERRFHRVLNLIEPSKSADPKLLNSLVSLFKAVDSLPEDIATSQTILSRTSDRANALMLIGVPEEGARVLRVPLTWVRNAKGQWFVSPDARRGGITFTTHQ